MSNPTGPKLMLHANARFKFVYKGHLVNWYHLRLDQRESFLSDSHLVRKLTLNRLAKVAKFFPQEPVDYL